MHRVTVANRIDDRSNRVRGQLFTEKFLLDDPLEKLTALHQLHHHIEFIFGVVDFVELHDVRVVDLGKDLDFISEIELLVLASIFETALVDDLDGDLLSRLFVIGFSDQAESSPGEAVTILKLRLTLQ